MDTQNLVSFLILHRDVLPLVAIKKASKMKKCQRERNFKDFWPKLKGKSQIFPYFMYFH